MMGENESGKSNQSNINGVEAPLLSPKSSHAAESGKSMNSIQETQINLYYDVDKDRPESFKNIKNRVSGNPY